jgi:uncharacterized protein (TIGR02996 family)
MNHEAFLPAIIEAPDDDTPRLVCADWLEEHGQGDRAEFIRAQIALAQAASDEERRRLRERAGELLAAHEEEWAAPLLGLVNKVCFRRGFVERVTLTVPDFLDSAEQLFALAPVREAVFIKTGPGLGQLADCPHLARLALLDFRDSAFEEDELPTLFASPHLGGLRTFVLRLRAFGDDVLRALAGAERPPRWTTLDLYDASVSGGGLEALAGSPAAGALEALVLGGSYELDEGAALPLTRSPHLARLRTLHLAFARLGDRDARALAEAPHLADLQRLDLRHNAITAAGARRLRQRFGDRVHL